MHETPGEPVSAEKLRPAINCPRCKRIFNIPAGETAGSLLTCPFCSERMVLRERLVLVAEAVEAA